MVWVECLRRRTILCKTALYEVMLPVSNFHLLSPLVPSLAVYVCVYLLVFGAFILVLMLESAKNNHIALGNGERLRESERKRKRLTAHYLHHRRLPNTLWIHTHRTRRQLRVSHTADHKTTNLAQTRTNQREREKCTDIERLTKKLLKLETI